MLLLFSNVQWTFISSLWANLVSMVSWAWALEGASQNVGTLICKPFFVCSLLQQQASMELIIQVHFYIFL